MKTLGQEETAQFIIAIGHFMCSISPKPARIENVRSRQDQSPPLIEETISPLQKLRPFVEAQMFNDLKQEYDIEAFLNLLQAVKVVKLLSVNIHALISQFWKMVLQSLLKVSVRSPNVQDLLPIQNRLYH